MPDPTDPLFESALQHGAAFHRAGRWAEAQGHYLEALRLRPGHPSAHNLMGVLAFDVGDIATARRHFEAGWQAAAGSALLFTNLARALYALGDWEALQIVLDEGGAKGLDGDVPRAIRQAAFGIRSRPKIFCIGRNKTGTTSLEQALASLGFSMGHQPRGELLLGDWRDRRFDRIAQLAQTADAFQDVPFSLSGIHAELDARFPNSRFILTVRDSADQWYRSVTRFHSKIVNQGHHLPTADELKRFAYRYPGYLWEAAQATYGITEQTLYDPVIYKRHYLDHNAAVERHFADRPGKLLVLNVSEPDSMRRVCDFLQVEWKGQSMPHANAT